MRPGRQPAVVVAAGRSRRVFQPREREPAVVRRVPRRRLVAGPSPNRRSAARRGRRGGDGEQRRRAQRRPARRFISCASSPGSRALFSASRSAASRAAGRTARRSMLSFFSLQLGDLPLERVALLEQRAQPGSATCAVRRRAPCGAEKQRRRQLALARRRRAPRARSGCARLLVRRVRPCSSRSRTPRAPRRGRCGRGRPPRSSSASTKNSRERGLVALAAGLGRGDDRAAGPGERLRGTRRSSWRCSRTRCAAIVNLSSSVA